MANGYVPKGYYTFNVEGRLEETALMHVPDPNSGVTIGKGYDMKTKSERLIYTDLVGVGISDHDAKIIMKASTLYGAKAIKFKNENNKKITPLTKDQQIVLFERFSYPPHLTDTKRLYNKFCPSKIMEKETLYYKNKRSRSELKWKGVSWDNLEDILIDIAVDLRYQGLFIESVIQLMSKNDIEYFTDYLSNSPTIQKYEKGRGRVRFIKGISRYEHY